MYIHGAVEHTVCDNHVCARQESTPFGLGGDANRAAHGCDIVIAGFVSLK
jgi:hypothetical protein